MKKQRSAQNRLRRVSGQRAGSSRFSKSTLPLRMLSGLESLEPRQMLAANILASDMSTLSATDSFQEAQLTVDLPTAAPGSEATLQITVRGANGSSLDPAAVNVVRANGQAMPGQMHFDDVGGTNDSKTIVALPEGEYGLRVSSESGAGQYTVEIAIIGDVAQADAAVGNFEELLASAAVVQTLGTGNFNTAYYYRSLGIDLNVPQADVGMDADGNGIINGSDLQVIQANGDVGTVNITLEVDSTPPEISGLRLVSDTGVSGSDRITTNVSTLVNISDMSEIVSLTGSVNGGAAVNLIPLVGDFNQTGGFLLDAADYDAIAGGNLSAGPVTLTLVAADVLGNVSNPTSFSFTFIDGNQSPTAATIPPQTATEDAAFSRNVAGFFTDSNPGDVLRFTATGLPNWLTLSPAGLLTGTPQNQNVGNRSFSIIATDSQGATATAPVMITVNNTNDAPVRISDIPPQTAFEDAPFTFDFSVFFQDQDVGDTLTFSAIRADGFDENGNVINGGDLPAWLMADDVNGVLTGTPREADVGSISIGIIAVDSVGETANGTFVLTINGENDPPALVSPIPDQTATEDQAFSLNLRPFFSDPDGETPSLSVTTLPSWLSFNATTGVLTGTPDDGDAGMTNITVTATDAVGASVSDTFSLTTNNVNDVPMVSNQSFNVNPNAANGATVGTIQATDDDVDSVLTYSVTAGDDNGIFAVNSSTGVITVANNSQLVDGETVVLSIAVSDGIATSNASVTIAIVSNLAPIANNDSGFSTFDNERLSIPLADLLSNDSDPENNPLSITSVTNSAQGATVTIVGGNVRYDSRTVASLIALREGQSVTDTFTYTVSDGNGGTDTATVSVLVEGTDVVQYRLEVRDLSGTVTTTLQPGETFELVAYVQDVTADPTGIFSAFIDVDYTASLAIPSEIIHSSTYGSGPSGSFATPGLLDEVGGTDGITPLGGNEFEVFRVVFTASSSAGVINFSANATEDQIQHPTLVFGDTIALPNPQIVFGSTSVTISSAGSASLSASGGSSTNYDNPLDVNADSFVSPLDALLVINALETGEVSESVHPDVNADGGVSPIDALLVINDLVEEQRALAAGAGGSSTILTGADADVSAADLADGLDALFGELASDLDSGLTIDQLQAQLSPSLIDAINAVLQANDDEQDDLWAALADDLAAYLTSNLGS